MSERILVLGTHNQKKLAELTELLQPYDITIKSLAEFSNAIEVEETGSSFQENAQLKAVQQAQHLGHWVMGEDSGLMVDALDGAPGIYSARFSGPNATDDSNNDLLLEKLGDLPPEKRGAQYVCHMSLATPEGEVLIDCEAYCRGRIRKYPSGSGGFGYDPLFEVREYHVTFGELSGALKRVLSHRARAMRQFIPELLKLIDRERGREAEA